MERLEALVEQLRTLGAVNRLLLAFLWLVMLGCVACRPSGFKTGGGRSVHIPPKVAHWGLPTPIKIELLTWGEGGSDLERRYSNVRLHYSIDKGSTLQTVNMRLSHKVRDSKLQDYVVYTGEIPAIGANTSELQYFIEFYLDGHQNRLSMETIPVTDSDTDNVE